jgi:hypothetical protein
MIQKVSGCWKNLLFTFLVNASFKKCLYVSFTESNYLNLIDHFLGNIKKVCSHLLKLSMVKYLKISHGCEEVWSTWLARCSVDLGIFISNLGTADGFFTFFSLVALCEKWIDYRQNKLIMVPMSFDSFGRPVD